MGSSAFKAKVNESAVDISHFTVQLQVGKGGFGAVNAVSKLTGEDKGKMYAMKTYNKEFLLDNVRRVDEVMWELGMLATLKHPFICNARYAFQDDQHCYLVMDLAMGGDLRFHLKKEKRFEEDRVRIYLAQVFLALQYLHSKEVLHRDMKPENVVMDTEGFLKVTDLGISAHLKDGKCVRGSGTPRYMAPELYTTSREHSYASDWWSYGVMAHELLTGRIPFKSGAFNSSRDIHVGHRDLENDAPGYPTPLLFFKAAPMSSKTSSYGARKDNKKSVHVTNECALFVDQLLQKNPARRLGAKSASEIKYHPFFHGFNWESLEARIMPVPFVPDTSHANCDLSIKKGKGKNAFEDMLFDDPTRGVANQTSFVVPEKDKVRFKDYHFHTVLDGQGGESRDGTREFSRMLKAGRVKESEDLDPHSEDPGADEYSSDGDELSSRQRETRGDAQQEEEDAAEEAHAALDREKAAAAAAEETATPAAVEDGQKEQKQATETDAVEATGAPAATETDAVQATGAPAAAETPSGEPPAAEEARGAEEVAADS